MRWPLALLVGWLAALAALRATGEEGATERRLREAGVDARLRRSVRAAVDRGVGFLVRRQLPDGSFAEHAPARRKPAARATFVTALCTTALRHAETPATVRPTEKALAWLCDADAARSAEIARHPADAGLVLALLASAPGRQALGATLLAGLQGSLDAQTGWWTGNAPGAWYKWPGPEQPWEGKPRPNLVDAQFALVGLQAARRAGLEVSVATLQAHRQGLIAHQTDRGSWPVTPAERGSGHSAGTYLGTANLLAVLRLLGAEDPASRPAVDRALHALARDATYTVTAPAGHFAVLEDDEAVVGSVPSHVEVRSLQRPTLDGWQDPGEAAYLRLFALSRACVAAGVEAFPVNEDERPVKEREKPASRMSWYARGAAWLLGLQHRDGGWPPVGREKPEKEASEMETAYAILFLVRAAQVL